MLFGLGMIFLAIGLIMLIIRVTTIGAKLIYCITGGIINQLILKPILRRSEKYKEYEEEMKLQEKIKEVEKERLDNQILGKKHDNIAYALSLKMEEFDERYRLADRDLIDKYRKNFMKVPMDELEAIEKEIEISHYNNTKQRQKELGFKPRNIYDAISLKKIPVIISKNCHVDGKKIELNIHQDEDTYIVYVNVPECNISRIFTTFDKIIAKRVQNSIATRCGLAALRNVKVYEVLNDKVLDEIIAGASQKS